MDLHSPVGRFRPLSPNLNPSSIDSYNQYSTDLSSQTSVERTPLGGVENLVLLNGLITFMKQVILATFLLLAFLSSSLLGASFGSSSAKGTTSGSFLKLGAGARASALGEAYSAVADEASALYWNPAALTQIPGGSLTVMHAAYIESSAYDSAFVAQNLGRLGSVALGGQFFTVGPITQTDVQGNELGTLNPHDMAVSFGYGHTLGKGALGFSGKFIQSTLLHSAQTQALDLGLLSPVFFQERLRLSLVMTNLGGRLKYDREAFDLPQALKVGSRLHLSPTWMVSLEGVVPNDNRPYVALGTEYTIPVSSFTQVALRMGGNSRALGDLEGLNSLSLGSGLNLRSFSIDYAFLPMGDLGTTHRFSLSYKWGGVDEAPVSHKAKRRVPTVRPASMRELFRQRFGGLEGPQMQTDVPVETSLGEGRGL